MLLPVFLGQHSLINDHAGNVSRTFFSQESAFVKLQKIILMSKANIGIVKYVKDGYLLSYFEKPTSVQ